MIILRIANLVQYIIVLESDNHAACEAADKGDDYAYVCNIIAKPQALANFKPLQREGAVVKKLAH